MNWCFIVGWMNLLNFVKAWDLFWKFPVQPYHINHWLLDKIYYTSKCDSTMTALIICGKEFNDVGIPVTSYGPQECLSFWLSSWKFSLDCWFTRNWTGFITEKCILQTIHLPLFWNTDFKLSDNIHNTENKCI